jgi:hypothetical protein
MKHNHFFPFMIVLSFHLMLYTLIYAAEACTITSAVAWMEIKEGWGGEGSKET